MTDYSGPLTTEGIDDGPALPDATPSAPPESGLKRTLRIIGWSCFALFCLVAFTLLKLPDDRIKNYVQGSIAAALAPKGIAFTADSGSLSLGWGLTYVMKGVTLDFPPPAPAAHLEKISFTPSLLPLIAGYQGGTLRIIGGGGGELTASVSLKNSQFSASFNAKDVNLGKTGILYAAAGVIGTGLLNGSGSVSGDLSVPSTLAGDVDLGLSKVVLDAQTLFGFAVPKLVISEGKAELTADKGKAVVKTLKLGKAGSTDDLIASGTGDVVLGRNWDSSTLNAKVNLKLSDTVMKAFILLDALLGAGKQGDGSYSLSLTGPVTMPNAVPLAGGGK